MVFGIRFFTELSWKKLGFCVIIPNNIRMQVGVAELADALALGASGVTRESSSLSSDTNFMGSPRHSTGRPVV